MLLHRNRKSDQRKKFGNEDLYSLESVIINKSIRELADGEEKDPIHRLRLLCFSRGSRGILGLGRVFRNLADDGTKTLNEEKFARGIKECGLEASDEDIKEMFHSFTNTYDENGGGSVHVTEFLIKLRPPMSQCRLDIIDQAFTKMDKTGSGIITLADLKEVYSVKEHPKYQSGAMTKDEIAEEFMNNFEGGHGYLNGKISKEEFINFYATISEAIDNDMYFDLVMRRSYTL